MTNHESRISNTEHLEIEAKFYVRDLGAVAARLEKLGAKIIQPRVHEINLRFDFPDGRLRREHRVLRLRRGDDIRLTYKGQSEVHEGALARQEIELMVSDFDITQAFLEALGYQVIAYYEKYRTMYALGEVHVMLDELPYGNFVEIEGSDVDSLRRTARDLGLDYTTAIPASYLALFERLCAERGLEPSKLTFAALKDIHPTPGELSIQPADCRE